MRNISILKKKNIIAEESQYIFPIKKIYINTITFPGGQKSHQQQAGGSGAAGGGWANPALAHGPTVPLSMQILDALTVHAKMSLIHSIGKVQTHSFYR